MQEQGYKRVAMIVATDIPTLVGLQDAFTEMAPTYGYEIVDVEETTSKATDLSSQLSKIVGTTPDAVVILGLAGQNPTIITQLKAAGYTGPIIAQGVVTVEDTDEADGGEALHERIKTVERSLLVDIVGRLAREGYRIEGRKVRFGS